MKSLLSCRVRLATCVGLWLLRSAVAAHGLDLGPLPLQNKNAYSDWQTLVGPADPSQEASERLISEPKNSRQQVQQGTSNDRILWTMPNFLTVENAEGIPPLSPGQKFKVTARGLFDPFECVLTGFVADLGQAANSNPSYGQGWRVREAIWDVLRRQFDGEPHGLRGAADSAAHARTRERSHSTFLKWAGQPRRRRFRYIAITCQASEALAT